MRLALKGETYLKKPADFVRLHRQGRYLAHPWLVVKSLPNGQAYPRWGVVVGKKLGGAVERNRIKRRLREILRQATIRPGRDVIIVARQGIAAVEFSDLQQAVLELLKKCNLVEFNEVAVPVVN